MLRNERNTRGADPLHLVRVAWHLGNRHLPTQIDSDRILIRDDHVIVDMLKGLGAEVTMITTSPAKGADAKALGADHVLISSDRDAMKAAARSFDFLLDTIPVAHDLPPYLALLDRQGTLCLVGAIDMLPSFHSGLLLGGQKAVAGSGIGGIAETQEMLDFCAEKDILPDVEVIRMDEINHAYERMERSDVKYRFVIDMATLAD